MKSVNKIIGIIALIAVIGSMTACGEDSSTPQGLAKQMWTLFEKDCKADGVEPNQQAYIVWAMKMMKEPTPAFSKIQEKRAKVISSNEDNRAFDAEFKKLAGF